MSTSRCAWPGAAASRAAVADTMMPLRYNDLAGLRRIFERDGDRIAGVIIEPVLGNAQGILPQAGFLAGVRALTEEFKALLIFDEVKTGFRFARGGAAEHFGIRPDLATYAKAMGNGYPVAAFGGRREVLELLPHHVSHGGTYAGNRVAASAAVATLTILKETDALATVAATGRRVQGELRAILDRRGLPFVFTGHPTMFGIMFTDVLPTDYRGWAEHRSRAVRRAGQADDPARGDARARLARAVVHVRGARGGRRRRPGRDRLRRCPRRGARGARRTRRPDRPSPREARGGRLAPWTS